MKYFIKYTLFIVGIAVALTACDGQADSLIQDRRDNNQPPPPASPPNGDSGKADFSNFIAIGNSLMAGTMDGALYNQSQKNAIPALLADRLKFAGAPKDFNQPDINSKRGFNESATMSGGPTLGRFKLNTDTTFAPRGPLPTKNGDKIGNYSGKASKLDNFGVPGILLGQLLTPATGGPEGNPAYNPYYARFASSPSTSRIIDDALATQPTFFTLWIGNNDVLGYATGGASNPGILTSSAAFQGQYNTVINALMNNSNAKGIVINIPPFLGLPFFHAVPYNAVRFDSKAQVKQLNQKLAPVNDALQALADNGLQPPQDIQRRKISYQKKDEDEPGNPILVNDPTLDDLEDEFDQLQAAGAIDATQRQKLKSYEQSRPLTKRELVTLPAGSKIGTEANPNSKQRTTIGVIVPLGLDATAKGDEYFLTESEQDKINNRREAFNQHIKNAVSSYGNRLALYNTNNKNGAFYDLFGLKSGDKPGITIDGANLENSFRPNGVISLDGVHPNPRGSAILANEIIGTIEDNFNSTIPKLDVLKLLSVQTCGDGGGNCVSN